MAGEWMKFEVDTPEKPEVFEMTVAMGWSDPDLTVGKLLKVWRWFDKHTINGNAPRVTLALLDNVTGVTGFAQAMCDVNWLEQDGAGVSLPNFDRHNGKTAKDRAQTAKRVAKHKTNGGGVSSNVTGPLGEPLPREEKILDKEVNIQKTSKKPPAAPTFDPEPALRMLGVGDQTVADWLALRKTKRATVTKTVIDTFIREAGKAGMDLDAVLSLCCSRGWTGFEAGWVLRDAPSLAAGRFDPTAHVNRNRPRPQ